MTSFAASQDFDANGRVIGHGLPFLVSKRITFDGGTSDAIGDKDGALATFPIFTVTGDVEVFVLGIVKTTLVGAATLEIGVANNTASIIAQVADATTLQVNEGWHDATSVLAEGFTPQIHPIGGGLDINGKVAAADITAGVIDFYCHWRPLSADGMVEAA
jgi:hypothetical protein